jgi:hypothetical protein
MYDAKRDENQPLSQELQLVVQAQTQINMPLIKSHFPSHIIDDLRGACLGK